MKFPQNDAWFPQTSWTLVDRLKSHDQDAISPALEELCSRYRYPLYCYLRRRGLDHQDAEDALHDFLARFLRQGSFETADKAKGRLRGYLATSMARHLGEWFRRRAAQPHLATESILDSTVLENNYRSERFLESQTPDQIFERKWALALLHTVLAQLGEQYGSRGKSQLFNALRPVLLSGGSLRGHDSPGLAASLSMTEEALRAALHRMLREFRDYLRAEVRQTVESAGEVDAEIDHLRALFSK